MSLYISTAVKGSSVIKSFYYSDQLIIVYTSFIEFYNVKNGSFDLIDHVDLYARISTAEMINSKLIVTTEKYQMLVLDGANCSGNCLLREPSGRPADGGHITIKDPLERVLLLYMYHADNH